MSNRQSNFPAPAADRAMNGKEYSGECIYSLMDLSALGKPKDEDELESRIVSFFDFCGRSCIRPGIEAISLALGVSRVCFWQWCNTDSGKSERWTELCRNARQIILTFLEQSMLSGHISPPSGIFLLKNLGDYKDTVSFTDITPEGQSTRALAPDEWKERFALSVQAERYEGGDTVESLLPTEQLN